MIARSNVPRTTSILDKITEANRTSARTLAVGVLGRPCRWYGFSVGDLGCRLATDFTRGNAFLETSGLLSVLQLLVLVGDEVRHRETCVA